MPSTETLNDELLNRWIRLSLAIINEKAASDLPCNEALLFHILYRQQRRQPDAPLTATDLCDITRMHKSQMNRTLTEMEERHLITRERSAYDRRQHGKILAIVDAIIARFGEEKTLQVIEMLDSISGTAREVLQT